MDQKNNVKGIVYFVNAFIIFGILGSEFGVLFVSRLIDGRSLEQVGNWPIHWYGAVAHWLITIAVWGLGALFYYNWARKKGIVKELISFQFDGRVLKLTTVAVIVVIVTAVIQSQVGGSTFPQILREYRGFQNMYGNYAFIVTLFQNIYYAFEMILVLMMVVFFQKAGELWFKNAKIPWASLGLMMTWGAIHFLSQPQGALTVTIWALVPGLFYVSGRKNFYPVYVTLLLGFII